MGQMFDKTRDQMNNSTWENHHTFGDQVDCVNLHTTSSRQDKRNSECSSRYGSDDISIKIELPSCRYYEPGDFMVVRPLNWDEIVDADVDDNNWADSGVPSSGRSCPSDGNDNDDGDGDEDSMGSAKGTRKGNGRKVGKGKWKATEDGKGKGRGKGKGNGIGKGIVKHTPAGDDIICAVALQLQIEMSEEDLDKDGELERVYSEPDASPAASISSDDTD
jgi:hypothetical protein